MKYYYNGELVRTSKNHIYTHAVVDTTDNSLKGCRPDEEKANAIITSEIASCKKYIKEKETAIKALKAGKTYYVVKERGRSYKVDFSENNTIERFEESIEWLKNNIKEIEKNWKVVELEKID